MVKNNIKNKTLLLVSNKIFIAGMALLFLSTTSFAIYISEAKFLPVSIKNGNEKIVDSILGKDLAKAIDEKRDEDGAISIRTLFNTNKEENLAKHCEKKEEKNQIQEECFKTYKNAEFGYSIKYPEDFNLTQNGNVANFFIDDYSVRGFSIYSYKDISESSEIWWQGESSKFDARYEMKKVMINSTEVIEYAQIGGLNEKHFIVKKNNVLLDILSLGLTDEENNSILTALKFN